MGILHILLFILVLLIPQIFLGVPLQDVVRCCFHSLVRYPDRVCSDIGDKAQGPMTLDIDSFI